MHVKMPVWMLFPICGRLMKAAGVWEGDFKKIVVSGRQTFEGISQEILLAI